MEGMLSFLLFAGALHVDLHELRRCQWAIGDHHPSAGILISTAAIGGGTWVICNAIGVTVPLLWCLLFGALISPTDPVAVLSILKRADVPPALEATSRREPSSTTVWASLSCPSSPPRGSHAGTEQTTAVEALQLFARRKPRGGGVLLGCVGGWLAFLALRSIDEHNLEVLITLALVMGVYALAEPLGASGPIATAVAGLIIGNQGRAYLP